jgi:hypothetical protein
MGVASDVNNRTVATRVQRDQLCFAQHTAVASDVNIMAHEDTSMGSTQSARQNSPCTHRVYDLSSNAKPTITYY